MPRPVIVSTWKVATIAVLLMAPLMVACDVADSFASRKTVTIEYRIDGTFQRAESISYTNHKGEETTVANVDLPWIKTIKSDHFGTISVHAWGRVPSDVEEPESITATVKEDGRLKDRSTSSGLWIKVRARYNKFY